MYIWGGGSEGQIGLGADEKEMPSPRRLPLDDKALSVACGYYHSAVVTGKVPIISMIDCVRPSVYLSVCLSVSVPICPSVCKLFYMR